MRWAGASSSASRRSRESARWAPRFEARTACTSSTITVSTPRSDSRAAEVSSRNRDSGVVTSTSGGVRAKLRRSSAGVSPVREPTRDVRLRQPEPVAGLAQPGQRRAQVALDVDRQGLHRGDVEDAAAPLRLLGHRGGRQPVQRPEERGQRLARAGGRDDERVLAVGDRVPRPGLRGRRLPERAGEPVARGGGEALEHAVGNGHPTMVPAGSDIDPGVTVRAARTTTAAAPRGPTISASTPATCHSHAGPVECRST